MRDSALPDVWWARRGPVFRSLVVTGTVMTGLAYFAITVAYLLAQCLVTTGAQQASLAWRRLGTYGRLVFGMVAVWPVADIARAVGLLPDWHLVSLLAGALGTAVIGGVLALLKTRGQREWRRHGGPVLPGGWEKNPAASARIILANAARLEMLEREQAELRRECRDLRYGRDAMAAKLADLFLLMAEATAAAGLPTPDTEATQPMRRLRLVTDGPAEEAGSA